MKLKPSTQQAKRLRFAYTLAEVMVAVFVIGITVISLYAAFFSGFVIVGLERENLRATQIMTRKAEGIRLCTWGQLTNSNFAFMEYYDPVMAATNASGVLYCGTVSNRSAAGILGSASYANNARLVTVNVYWTNYTTGKPILRSRQMQTLAARFGMQNYIWGSL